MMMEERKKFVCKYCSKRFPCGKSLGGHIRTHITEERTTINASSSPIAANTHDLLLKKRKRDSSWPTQSAAGGGGGGAAAGNNNNSPIYGLRENPKKTTRFVHIDGAAATNLAREKEERFCKECGKGFPSMKALCGHMACHSDKDKDREKLVVMAMDDDGDDDEYGDNNSQSDAESSGGAAASLLPRRRSKRMMRFKNLRPFCSSSPSASVSEVEQQQEEQEEVARMLMMLSRDSGRRGRFVSLTESSDNNSVVLNTNKVAAVTVSNNNGRKNFVPNDSDSAAGSLRSGLKNKMVDSDVSMDEFKGWKNVKDKDKERRSKYSSTVAFAAAVKDLEYETTISTTATTRKKFDFRKRANYDSLIHSSTEVPTKNEKTGFANDEYDDCSYDSTEYDDVDEDEESDENSTDTDTDSFPAPKAHSTKASTKANKKKKNMTKKKKLKSKKSKEHECPICYKIFKSGQALGGHKRSHFIGGSSEENTLVIKQHHAAPSSLVVVPNCLIDLNLPAPVDD
ncbi:hypothetical protein S245_010640 [Arachis hypogaea]